MNECAVVELSDGRLMLNMRSFRGKQQRAVSHSRNGGLTWSVPVDSPVLIEPVCQASLIRLPGPQPRLVFINPGSRTQRARSTLRVSLDDGQTWPGKHVIYPGPAAYTAATPLPGGQVGLLYERDGYRSITFVRLKP